MREIYLPAFEAAVKEAKVGTIMCAYNRLNGSPACENRELLDRILRRDWGFNGYVVADYGFATKSTAASANNGLELDMPQGFFYSQANLATAVATGQVSPATIDLRVGNILRTLFRFGAFDRAAYPANDALIDKAGHDAVAAPGRGAGDGAAAKPRDAAAEPLPAEVDRGDRLDGRRLQGRRRLVGDQARSPSAARAPRSPAAPARGCRCATTPATTRSAPPQWRAAPTWRWCSPPTPPPRASTSRTSRPTTTRWSRPWPRPTRGPRWCSRPPGPVLTPWRERVNAIVEAWYPGQAAGRAIARVLFGDADPGGRLPATFPRRMEDVPTTGDREAYPGVIEVKHKEGVFVGYRHYDQRRLEPAYPFGHGLSYTRFSYRGLRIRKGRGGDTAAVSVEVRNTGRRTGTEVAQLYLGLPDVGAAIRQPPRALKGARKLTLRPGQRRRVGFRLDARALSYWNEGPRAWRVASGCYGWRSGARRATSGCAACSPCGRTARRREHACRAARRSARATSVAIRVGLTRSRLARRIGPSRRGRLVTRWCVKRSRGRVSAVFGSRSARSTRAAGGHDRARATETAGCVRAPAPAACGAPTRACAAWPGGVYRAYPSSPRLFGVRRGRVRFIGVASRAAAALASRAEAQFRPRRPLTWTLYRP